MLIFIHFRGHFFAVLAIGLGQIIGGVLLCVFTCGAAGDFVLFKNIYT